MSSITLRSQQQQCASNRIACSAQMHLPWANSRKTRTACLINFPQDKEFNVASIRLLRFHFNKFKKKASSQKLHCLYRVFGKVIIAHERSQQLTLPIKPHLHLPSQLSCCACDPFVLHVALDTHFVRHNQAILRAPASAL